MVPNGSRGARRPWSAQALVLCLGVSGALSLARILSNPPPGATAGLCSVSIVASLCGQWITTSYRRTTAALAGTICVVLSMFEGAAAPVWRRDPFAASSWHGLVLAVDHSDGRALLGASALVALVGVGGQLALIAGSTEPAVGPALAAVPALFLVVWSTATAPGTPAALLAGVTLLLAAVALLGVERAPLRAALQGRRLGPLVPPVVVFALVTIGVALSGAVGPGAGNPAAASFPTDEALATNIVGFADQYPDVVLFRAHTTLPTYWQVAILDRLVGDTWRPSGALTRALAGEETAGPSQHATAGTLVAKVTIDSYGGRVLPVPIDTTAVAAPRGTEIVDGAVVQTTRTVAGERYTASAVLANGAAVQATIPVSPSEADLDLTVPPLPPAVTRLARQVTRGSTAPADVVQRLINWFRSGRFRYTTAPQSKATSQSALVSFLTRTRVGNCQTYTDAFTLMARSLGIPTRVAVGFTAGSRAVGGNSTVTGADAHTWPEVDIGSGGGWESVEPTPASAAGSAIAVGVLGPGAVGPPETTPISVPTGVGPLPPPTGTTPTSTPSSVAPAPSASAGAPPWWWLGPALGLLATALALLWRRRRGPRGITESDAVLQAWARCDRSLARAGLGCPYALPHLAHVSWLVDDAERLSANALSGADSRWSEVRHALRRAELVAELETQARYGGRPVTKEMTRRAAQAVAEVERALRGRAARRCAEILMNQGTRPALGASSRYGPRDPAGAARAGAFRSGG
ncbi:MAG: transglutaminaseTgpA domain-containing protein [Acidimicrobiales bacterium]